jgi:hypothetical protein
MNFEELKDKSICLIVENAEKADDMHVYLGKLYFSNNKYQFVNQEKGWRVSLEEEHLSRLKPVKDSLKEILLNADYSLTMSMGSLPDSDVDNFQSTGMNWHD